MKTVYKLILSLPIAILIIGCSIVEEPISQETAIPIATETRSDVINVTDIYYHEGTGLVLQAYNIYKDPQVHRVDENIEGVTHIGVKFFPKDIEQQRQLSNSEVATVRYIPFGYSPVVPDGQDWAKDITALPKFPEISPYTIDTKGFKTTEPSMSESINPIRLPIMYALWPVSEPLPEEIDYEVCFKVIIPEEQSGISTRSQGLDYQYDAQFRSYDALLDEYVPMSKLKVELVYGIYSYYTYTNSSGNVSLFPTNISGLSESYYGSLSVVVLLESTDWIISRNDNNTPIQYLVGTTGSLWDIQYGGDTYVCDLTSVTTEYEIHRAVDHYFNTNHTISQGIINSERGIVYHAMDIYGTKPARTIYYSSGYAFVEVNNHFSYQKDCIGSVLHEVGHVRSFKHKGFSSFDSSTDELEDSYASFVGWYLSRDYYVSQGFIIPNSSYQINNQGRQNWVSGSGDIYTPFFVDLNDSYNQANLNDPISGVPANLLDYAALTYSSIMDCGTYLYTFAGSYFTSTQLSDYLTYYTGM